jgi:hypothetical protein
LQELNLDLIFKKERVRVINTLIDLFIFLRKELDILLEINESIKEKKIIIDKWSSYDVELLHEKLIEFMRGLK